MKRILMLAVIVALAIGFGNAAQAKYKHNASVNKTCACMQAGSSCGQGCCDSKECGCKDGKPCKHEACCNKGKSCPMKDCACKNSAGDFLEAKPTK